MERTIDNNDLQRVNRIATEDTILHSCLEALLDRGDELLGDVTTFHLVDELQTTVLLDIPVLINRTDIYDDISELTATTRLLLVNLTVTHDSLGDGFLIVNLGLTMMMSRWSSPIPEIMV